MYPHEDFPENPMGKLRLLMTRQFPDFVQEQTSEIIISGGRGKGVLIEKWPKKLLAKNIFILFC